VIIISYCFNLSSVVTSNLLCITLSDDLIGYFLFEIDISTTSFKQPRKIKTTLKHLAEDLKALGYEIEIKNIHPAQQPKVINALS